MKKLLILLGVLVSLTAANVVFAQTTEGVITYEIKVNMHRRLPPDRQDMKAMIPEFRTTKEQLFFNASESLYKPLIEDEEQDMTASGGGVHIRMQQPNNEFYFDQNTQTIVSKQEFMGKHYLIEDTLKVSPWKFGTETKTIQGYECKQAYYTDESRPEQKMEITAWYTDKIRPFLGPERFLSLPGAVLAVDINNAERVIVAKTIEMRPLKKSEMKKPSGGQKSTQAEFRKMVEEQMKQMGGRGGVIIRN
ncbi:MAG: GLPGLI family protein [Bacteroidota bacterium]